MDVTRPHIYTEIASASLMNLCNILAIMYKRELCCTWSLGKIYSISYVVGHVRCLSQKHGTQAFYINLTILSE